MSLIIQLDDGSIVDANTYVDMAFADDYFTLRNVSEWFNLSVADREVALIKAMDHIEANYLFDGQRLSETQNTAFPRINIYYDGAELSAIPIQLKKAQCEFAVLSSSQSLDNNYDYAQGSTLASESVEIAGAIKESKSYDNSSFVITPRTKKHFDSAEKYLKNMVKSGSGGFGNATVERTY